MEKPKYSISIYPIKSSPNAGKYAGYVEIPTEKGEPRNRPTRYGKDETEVMKKLAPIIVSIENGKYVKPFKESFINFLKEYHKACAGYDMWDEKEKG